jgi:hypothetical protein
MLTPSSSEHQSAFIAVLANARPVGAIARRAHPGADRDPLPGLHHSGYRITQAAWPCRIRDLAVAARSRSAADSRASSARR